MKNLARSFTASVLLATFMGPALAAPLTTRPLRSEAEPPLSQERDDKVAAQMVGCYDLLLYFGNTAPFLDAIGIGKIPSPGFFTHQGRMEVPRDFNAAIEFRHVSENRVVFDVRVPRNISRPKDLVFRYDATFRGGDYRNGAGLATVVAEGDAVTPIRPVKPYYVASFLLFKTKDTDPFAVNGGVRSCLKSDNPRPIPTTRAAIGR